MSSAHDHSRANWMFFQVCSSDRRCVVDLSRPLPLGGDTVLGWQVWPQLSDLHDNPDLQDGPDVYVRSVPGKRGGMSLLGGWVIRGFA